jgi:hypothetical protein
MKRGNTVVYGIFDYKGELEECVTELKNASFRSDDVSVLMPSGGDQETFGHEKSTKAPEGAAIGTSAGAVFGGALGWLVGAGTVALAPAFGPLVAAGPILAALAGVGAGGALGGLAGALIGAGIPEYEAKRYENFLKKGGMLLSVHADDSKWADKAKRILEQSAAHDVAVTSEEPSTKPTDRSKSQPVINL